jgi:hypothetical protein
MGDRTPLKDRLRKASENAKKWASKEIDPIDEKGKYCNMLYDLKCGRIKHGSPEHKAYLKLKEKYGPKN